jgi:hypothetical protein
MAQNEKRTSEASDGVFFSKDGEVKKVSFGELSLSNTLSLEALVALLVRRKVIKAQDLLDEIQRVKNVRFREGLPPDANKER